MKFSAMFSGKLAAATMLALASCAPAASQALQSRPCPAAIGAGISRFTAEDENGAHLLAAKPENWNGSLIVHTYGGPRMRPPHAEMVDEELAGR
jgi:hypothetical protein